MQQHNFVQRRIQTPLGDLCARWTATGLYSCEFASAQLESSDPACEKGIANDCSDAPEWMQQVDVASFQQAVDAYFHYGSWPLPAGPDALLGALDWHGVNEFSQAVLRCCFAIPPGSTRTYGQVALQAGQAGAAQAVGRIMAANRWPLLIPCHRVVGSGGKMVGYSGNGGIGSKRDLLLLEQSKAAGTAFDFGEFD